MGGFVNFWCGNCKYEETDIGVGRGKQPFPFLLLYRCDNCKTIGSTWVHENRLPRCAGCYHDAVIALAEDTARVNCPKCGEPGKFTPGTGTWE